MLRNPIVLLVACVVACSDGKSPTGPSITPTQLALTTSAAGAASSAAFGTQPVVAIRDAQGNTVTSATGVITMTASAGGTVVGTATATAVVGVATFATVGLSGTVGTYTLTFATGALTAATQTIALAAGAATQLVLTTSAAGAASSAAFGTQPVVAIRDAQGNTVTSATGVITMTASAGGTVVGTATATAVAGVATFATVGLSGTVGTYTLTFATGALTAATQTIALAVGTATQLVLTRAAAGAANLAAFGTQPTVTVHDAAGNTVTSDNGSIIAMTASAGATTLGAASATASSGVATFTTVGISGTPGTSYSLVFSRSGLASATQAIVAAPAAVATVSVSPSSSSLFAAADTVQLSAVTRDASGAILTGRTVTWSSSNTAIATVSTTGLVTTVNAGTATITPSSEGQISSATVAVTATGWTATGANQSRSCGLKSSNALFCWGAGVLGASDSTVASSSTPLLVKGGRVWLSVAVGYQVTCGIQLDRKAYCWGVNGFGELGNGTAGNATARQPQVVLGGLRWRSIGIGEYHVCGLSAQDEVWCWGNNAVGQLGDSTLVNRTTPVLASVVAGPVDSLVVGATGVCAKPRTGAFVCWGRFDNGSASTMTPRAPGGGSFGWTYIALVGQQVICGVTTPDAQYCGSSGFRVGELRAI